MRVCILADPGNADGTLGGAELTMREFAEAAPDDVELVDSLDCDAVVVGNCVTFGPDLIPQLEGKRVVRYFNDLDPNSHPELRGWLLDHATLIFTSPYHLRAFPHEIPDWAVTHIIPPPVKRPNREARRNGNREGAVAIGAWQNPGKGQQLLREWSDANGPVDVFGQGAYFPAGGNLNPCGPLEPDEVPLTLAHYEKFVHLPTDPEPFGRAVVEAHLAGCKLVTNRNVGALHYIEGEPEKLQRAAEDFWQIVRA